MNVAVLVPRGEEDDPERHAAWQFVSLWLDTHHRWPVRVGVVPAADWRKADAVAAALRRVRRGAWPSVLIIHDADVIVAPDALRAAVAIVEAGRAWAVPHQTVLRLNADSTHTLEGTGRLPEVPHYTRWPYVGIPGGGITVVRADVYDACPIDRRFVGWGGEDQAWGWALETLFGAPWREADADLLHLWHPHPAPGAQRNPKMECELLRRQYRSRRGKPDAMRALLDSAA